jgi:anti-sigma regulatory factor (Ser/Thr protein kinase)
MGKLRHAINAVSLYEDDPARILDVAEYVLLQRYPDAIATAFLAIVDTTERRIAFANAGHPYPFVRTWDGAVERLVAEGLPVGSRMLAAPAQSRTRTLEDIAMIAFYTDGVTESTRNLEAGERLLVDTVSTNGILYTRAPATMLSDTCIPDGPHDDDAALMVLSFPRSIGWSFEAENARAAQTARGAFVARLRAEATHESDFTAAEIVFGELVGNVVRHAPGSIDVALEWSDDRAVLHVVDRGPGFDYRPPPKEVDVMREDGRGLWLAHQFGEEVTVERLPGFGSHVSVVLPVRRASGASRKPAKEAATTPG